MSISTAIEFRKSIGGEERIMEYCHDLAVKSVICQCACTFELMVRCRGGKRLSQRFGTGIMENDDTEKDGELTAAMVNPPSRHRSTSQI
jgi:hypothetical protein